MTADVHDASQIMREFVAAVEAVAAFDRHGLTIWDAIAEAIHEWIGTADPCAPMYGDPLRVTLTHLMASTAEQGAPGGQAVADLLGAALLLWTRKASTTFNDGMPFER